mgnify:FL=1
MRSEFAKYLVEQGYVDAESAHEAASAAQDVREVIGALAFRYDLMTPQDGEEVLNLLTPEQRFGKIAAERGFLSDTQVNCLLQIQEMEEVLEIGGNLILKGKLSRDNLVDAMHVFIKNNTAESSVAGGQCVRTERE